MKKFFCLIFVLICFLSGCQNHYSCTQAIKERFPDSEIEVLSGQPIDRICLSAMCRVSNEILLEKEGLSHLSESTRLADRRCN